MTKYEFVQWLSDHGAAEDLRGYGHITCEELATLLLANFLVAPRFEVPSNPSTDAEFAALPILDLDALGEAER